MNTTWTKESISSNDHVKKLNLSFTCIIVISLSWYSGCISNLYYTSQLIPWYYGLFIIGHFKLLMSLTQSVCHYIDRKSFFYIAECNCLQIYTMFQISPLLHQSFSFFVKIRKSIFTLARESGTYSHVEHKKIMSSDHDNQKICSLIS